MSLRSKNFPYAYYQGKVFCFDRSKKTRFSYFGGAPSHGVAGIEHGPRPLHHILTIWKRDLGISKELGGTNLPFFYGMCFNGCSLQYKRSDFRNIEVTKLAPTESSDDWPYPYYPIYLPYVPIEVTEARESSLEEFSDSVMQGVKNLKESELIVVVPPNPEINVSIWGPDGDQEDVQIIFRHDTENEMTKAYSACT